MVSYVIHVWLARDQCMIATWSVHDSHVICAWSVMWSVHDQLPDQCMISHVTRYKCFTLLEAIKRGKYVSVSFLLNLVRLMICPQTQHRCKSRAVNKRAMNIRASLTLSYLEVTCMRLICGCVSVAMCQWHIICYFHRTHTVSVACLCIRWHNKWVNNLPIYLYIYYIIYYGVVL